MSLDVAMPSDVTTRLVEAGDVQALAALALGQRRHLQPTSPEQPDDFYTERGQANRVIQALADWQAGTQVPWVIVVDGAIVGRVTLNSVIRGAFQSASVGYWVAAEHCGRGIAGAALDQLVAFAFEQFGLHRLQGETLPANLASRRVLERAGFVQYGTAPDYLRIASRWQEHVLYQLTREQYEPLGP